jgi:hypothetical protein
MVKRMLTQNAARLCIKKYNHNIGFKEKNAEFLPKIGENR